jgi:hypothetical protein
LCLCIAYAKLLNDAEFGCNLLFVGLQIIRYGKGVVFLIIFSSNLYHFCHNVNPNFRVHLLDIPNLLSVFLLLDMFDVPFWPAYLLPSGSVVNCLFGRYLSVNSLAFLTGAVNEILIYCELLI